MSQADGNHAMSDAFREQLRAPVTPELHKRIRRLWLQHVSAEDARDLDGLIATLSEDCVYELVPTGERWEGHDGARAFYTGFLDAFPDVEFDLTDIVIGPQGVVQISDLRGTHLGRWFRTDPTGRRLKLQNIIHFPWDAASGRFAGERVYFDAADLARQLSPP